MATSRVHTPPRLRSSAELIPAAGQWTRCARAGPCEPPTVPARSGADAAGCLACACRSDHRHAYPCTMGHTWYATGGDLTARRRELGGHVTEDEVGPLRR